jgi:hypothetical protein
MTREDFRRVAVNVAIYPACLLIEGLIRGAVAILDWLDEPTTEDAP